MDATESEAGWRRVCRRSTWSLIGPALGIALTAGCAGQQRVERVRIANETLGPMTVAVAPALNLSGASDFDPNRFADLMASELSFVEGVTVIPVSRVLGMLTAQGHTTVASPEHAWELVKLLGSDAILVFAITEYDPYDPPSIGISAQLYGKRSGPGGGSVDPVALSRRAALASSSTSGSGNRLLAQSQQVIDASHGHVVDRIREYARLRGGGDSPFGWRKFMVSQRDYIRFCCYVTIFELVSGRDDPRLAEGGRER